MNINVLKVNAFTESLDGGNSAGVLLDSPDLTDKQMMQISREVSVSETAFIFPSKKADYKVLFFSPTVEVDLCGHGTIATFYTMALKGLLSQSCVVTQETKAGVLPVNIMFSDNKLDRVIMTQAKPILKPVDLDFDKISSALNIQLEDIDTSLPQQIVSTGLFTLPVSINSLKTLKTMNPDFNKVEQVCKLLGVGGFHVFTFETIESVSLYHARNFAPLYGTNEDPVTGTANGAVVSYLVKNNIIDGRSFICEQGDIIGRPGRVFVEIDENDSVKVGGRARIVEEIELDV